MIGINNNIKIKLKFLDYIYLLFTCTLLIDRVKILNLGGISLFPYQAITFILAFLIFIYYKKIYIPTKVIYIYFFILIVNLVNILIGDVDTFIIIKESIQTILLIILAFIIYNYLIYSMDKFINFVEYAYIFWIVTSIIFVLGYYILGSKFGVYYSDFLPYPRVTGFNVDPNVFGIYILTFLPLVLYNNKNSILKKIVINMISLITILLTFSRANTIAIIIFLIIYILLSLFLKINDKKEIFTLFISITIILIVIFLVPSTREAIMIRVEQLFMQASSNSDSRFGIWIDAVNLLKDNLILGVGIDHPIKYIGKYVHNTYLEILLSFGIIGIVLISKYFVNMFKHLYKIKKDDFNFYLALSYINHILVLNFVSLINFEPTIILFVLTNVYFRYYSTKSCKNFKR